MGGHTTGVLLGTTLVGTTLVWSQRSLEADGEWAAGLMGQRGKPSRRREGARAGAPGGRIAFVPRRGKAAARRWPMWPPCRAVPFCAVLRRAARRQAGPEHVQLQQAPGREPQRRGCEPGGEEGP